MVIECLQCMKRYEMARQNEWSKWTIYTEGGNCELGKARQDWNQEIRIFIETQEQRQNLKSEPGFVDTGHHPEDNLTCGQLSLAQ